MSSAHEQDLFFTNAAVAQFCGGTWIHVPVLLQVEDTPLIELVRRINYGIPKDHPQARQLCPGFSIYHNDGTLLARVRGARAFPTKEGEAAGVRLAHEPGLVACDVAGRTAFELRYEGPAALSTEAELYSPHGHFFRATKGAGEFMRDGGRQVSKRFTIDGPTFAKHPIGILFTSSATPRKAAIINDVGDNAGNDGDGAAGAASAP